MSRRRWTADLRHEAIAGLRRFSAVPGPVVLIGIDPGPFFAVTFSNAEFLRQPEGLIEAVGYFAIVAESGDGLLIFEWYWTAPYEGDWGELATWGSFQSLAH